MSASQRLFYPHENLPKAYSQLGATPTQRVLLASVARESCVKELKYWLQESLHLPLEIISAQVQACGVTNCYTQADRLGADRWAALIAARYLMSGAVCVIDCGTATTFDVIDAEGQHLGGLIIPGLAMMRFSLAEKTACIPADASSGIGEGLLACDTLSAVSGGSLQATAGFIERLQRDVCAMINAPLTSVICGGNAPSLLPLLADDIHHEPDLVLKGLNIIAMSQA